MNKKYKSKENIILLISALLILLLPSVSFSVTPGPLRSYSTIYSIGVEWDVSGDTDHDAKCAVQYRVQGSGIWKQAQPLIRVDGSGFNMLAGSIFFLDPESTYEVKLDMFDPDGGSGSQTVTVSTKAIPSLPTGGSTYHVVPGSGGGTGTEGDPFKGISAAQALAQPGDIFLLHTGNYGTPPYFDKSGEENNHIVWKAAGDGNVTFYGITAIPGSNLWFEGINFIGDGTLWIVQFGKHPSLNTAVHNMVFIKNNISNCTYCLLSQRGGTNWYIADNVITGNVDYTGGSFGGEGIELTHLNGGHVSGHTIARNTITGVGDGISIGIDHISSPPSNNIDIFGNDIYETSDDGIELDGGSNNIRIWSNRITSIGHNTFSFQEHQRGGPAYFIRNQIVNNGQNTFKGNAVAYVMWHNIFAMYGTAGSYPEAQSYGDALLRAPSRNNLWVYDNGGLSAAIWWIIGEPNWLTDTAYNGFDTGSYSTAFKYNSTSYSSLEGFKQGTGFESSSIMIDKDTCFETFDLPGPFPTHVPTQVMSLNPGCNAVNAGTILHNINDNYSGSAPDLGPYEYGSGLPDFGPLSGSVIYYCSDGIDNDGDGLIDYPSDPGCSSASDNNEYDIVADSTPPAKPTHLVIAVE